MDKRIEDYLNQIIQADIENVPVFYKSSLNKRNAESQTPIEKLMYLALIHVMNGSNFGWGIDLQKQIGKYRADFLIGVRWRKGLATAVVECDGHEFHEKTKLQVERDKKRDRFMQGQGYHVFRFSGSEIWRDPTSCAQEILDYFKSTTKAD